MLGLQGLRNVLCTSLASELQNTWTTGVLNCYTRIRPPAWGLARVQKSSETLPAPCSPVQSLQHGDSPVYPECLQHGHTFLSANISAPLRSSHPIRVMIRVRVGPFFQQISVPHSDHPTQQQPAPCRVTISSLYMQHHRTTVSSLTLTLKQDNRLKLCSPLMCRFGDKFIGRCLRACCVHVVGSTLEAHLLANDACSKPDDHANSCSEPEDHANACSEPDDRTPYIRWFRTRYKTCVEVWYASHLMFRDFLRMGRS